MNVRPLQRYHSLDALRASMMLLGIVLHSAVNYAVFPMGEAWPFKDPKTSSLFDLMVFVIHLFRMPVFFVAAGFFAALLMQRDGPRAFAVNRTKRVLLPLVLFWPLVLPAVLAGFLYANMRAGSTFDVTAAESGPFLNRPLLAHLWFLWDLAIFCAAATLLAPLVSRLPERWTGRIDSAFGAVANSLAGALAMSIVTALTLLPMQGPALETSSALLPPFRILVAYGVFFTFGWLLFRRRDIIESFGTRCTISLLLGAAGAVGYLMVTVGRRVPDPSLAHVVGCAFAGLTMWLLIYGIVGAFVRLLDRPSPIVRYLSDASYWMYMVHLPFTLAVPGLLAPSPLPAMVKFAITVTVTTVATLVSYHYLVRATVIGELLNGRRYRRALPEVAPARQTAAL
jgi:glucan biosynthesis protein C